MKKIAAAVFACVLGCVLGFSSWVWWMHREEEPGPSAELVVTPELIARGAYLARVGNCAACHTQRGGSAYAGGLGLATPFGTVYSSNLTPDAQTGIGGWSSADFWRALHHGRSRDGRLLYPAFPYTSMTQVGRADADALFAYLQSLPATVQAATPHALRWPYSTQPALAVWRALYFRPGVFQPDASQPAAWNRGAYLVRGLGHCAACHTPRTALGGSDDSRALQGGLVPVHHWYAPALAGLPQADTLQLLRTGVTAQRSVLGPMADVVRQSTQFWTEGDLGAVAVYLHTLPAPAAVAQQAAPSPPARVAQRGAQLYEQHCVQCHGAQGQGVAAAYPALAANPAVTRPDTANLVQVVRNGGFAPATAGNPRPFGMPPFVLVLSDADIAAVLTHIRTAWGNRADGVTELEVQRLH